MKITKDMVNYNELNSDMLDGYHSTDIVPIGSIFNYLPGYFTSAGNAGYTEISLTLPANWKVCDGSLCNDPDSPIFNGSDRYLPNLTDSRFIMGSILATAGIPGGNSNNQVSLGETNLPAHTHDYGGHWSNDNSNTVASPEGNGTGNTYQDGVGYGIASSLLDTYGAAGARTGVDYPDHSHTTNYNIWYRGSEDNIDSASGDASYSPLTTGGANSRHYHPLPNHRHWIKTRTSTSTGSGTAFSILPKYLTATYIIRIK